jgi:hypothetical protein
MHALQNSFHRLFRFGVFLVLAIALPLSGCAIKLVADYDSVAFEEILKVGKKVDKFYGDLLETKQDERQYQKYRDRYVDVETDIRSLLTRNQARALNEESTQISEITLNLWIKYKDNHASKNGYSDGVAKLDRKRFVRLFAAAASAERAKNLDSDDKNADKDSK